MIGYLPSKHEALSSNPNISETKTKKQNQKEASLPAQKPGQAFEPDLTYIAEIMLCDISAV
jgi:hypothetical protein